MADSSGSLLSGIAIAVEKVQETSGKLRTGTLAPVADAFAKNITRVRDMLTLPHFTTSTILQLAAFGVSLLRLGRVPAIKEAITQVWRAAQEQRGIPEDAVRTLIGPHVETLNTAMESVGAEDEQKVREYAAKFWQVAEQKTDWGVREWVEGQLAAATAGAWTAFECLATDLWVVALNAYPSPFATRAATSREGEDTSDGLTSKVMPIAMLGQYGFDMRNHMGTVLKRKFDLTSLENIRTAYRAAFPIVSRSSEAFRTDDLRFLEACRHVIVHRAGVVDTDFTKKMKGVETDTVEGQQLPLTGAHVSRFANAAIDAAVRLLNLVDCSVVAEAAKGISPPSADDAGEASS